MKVLLLGGGGREHALGWALSRSDHCSELVSLPGNPGLSTLGAVVEGIDPSDVGAVAAFASQQGFDFVVVGPEAPLAAGVADALAAAGIPVFGPSKAAARLEASKSFAKEIMAAAGVPTGAFSSFTTPDEAKQHLSRMAPPYVIKADGLAAGKGVLVTDDRQAADEWVDKCLGGSLATSDLPSVVIEEYLDGPELSVFFVCDGTRAIPMQPARDYKRLLDGDEGPNTGGMGSYSPVDDLPPGLVEQVQRDVALPVLRTMAERGTPYSGFLYVGLALTTSGPKVIEFNCRLGDPETQAVLPLLETDLLSVLYAAATGSLEGTDMQWTDGAAVNVVLAAQGYPESPRKGDPINGVATIDSDRVLVFHAGTSDEDGRLRVNGGRVLSLVGLGSDVAEARTNAYAAAEKVRWPGKQYRTDIAGGAT